MPRVNKLKGNCIGKSLGNKMSTGVRHWKALTYWGTTTPWKDLKELEANLQAVWAGATGCDPTAQACTHHATEPGRARETKRFSLQTFKSLSNGWLTSKVTRHFIRYTQGKYTLGCYSKVNLTHSSVTEACLACTRPRVWYPVLGLENKEKERRERKRNTYQSKKPGEVC